MNQGRDNLDVIVIGGGISGIIFLKNALESGLRCKLVEREPTLGGLWAKLPAWQDLQLRKEDWTVNRLPIKGIGQGNVLENIHSWVDTYKLGSFIQTGTSVTKVTWSGSFWEVFSSKGTLRATHLVVATGLQNIPYVPPVEKNASSVLEFHSSIFPDPEILKGQKVVVVGGGASAFDLLDLAIGRGASEIHWVYRSTKWMVPSTQPKDAKPQVRMLAYRQMFSDTVDDVNRQMRGPIEEKYRHFGMESIRPTEPLDLRQHQVITGRPLMTKYFQRIERHVGTIKRIKRNTVDTGNEQIAADIVLYGTGYRLDLSYLGLPEYGSLQTHGELRAKCGSLVLALDYPNLYFVGPTIIDSNGSVPLNISTVSRTIVAHMRGKCEIPRLVSGQMVNHWDLFKLMASFDRSSYPIWWKLKYKILAYWYLRFPNSPIRA